MAQAQRCPALLVAAPASGQGKTTVVAALARLHTRLGRRVRVFKCGPDFLDPQIHAIASGAPCYNLDLWMCGEDDARRRLAEAAADADLKQRYADRVFVTSSPYHVPLLESCIAGSAADEHGEVDAGIVRACLPEQLARQGELRLAEFRVLSHRQEEGLPCALSTPLYPNWPIAVTRHTDTALAKEVAHALLSMPAGSEGPTWTVPADYQPVHDLYRELRIGPYAYLRDITPEGLLRRFWPWLVIVMGTKGVMPDCSQARISGPL